MSIAIPRAESIHTDATLLITRMTRAQIPARRSRRRHARFHFDINIIPRYPPTTTNRIRSRRHRPGASHLTQRPDNIIIALEARQRTRRVLRELLPGPQRTAMTSMYNHTHALPRRDADIHAHEQEREGEETPPARFGAAD